MKARPSNIPFRPVSEPQTHDLLLAGLGVLGFHPAAV
jgi:hypothetical protein